MDRGAWWSIVHGVAKSWTGLGKSDLSCFGVSVWIRVGSWDCCEQVRVCVRVWFSSVNLYERVACM